MIYVEGYNDVIEKVYQSGNQHVFAFWDSLNEEQKKHLLQELSLINFQQLHELYELTKKHVIPMDFEPAFFTPLPQTIEEQKLFEEAKHIGIDTIKASKVAAFVVAGGQGSRLGFEGPKGMFPIGPVSNKTLFQIHAEKIKAYENKFGVDIPWCIMTSQANHDATIAYFEENNYFQLNKNKVFIFKQNMIPSLDEHGKLILETPYSIFKNPDGHGGSLTALYQSGTLDTLQGMGIEVLSYFQVDNPLVRIIDPVFIGFHIKNNAEVSSKTLKKAYPEEKIGVFVKFSNGRVGVVEYSDLSHDKQFEKDQHGNLRYIAGSIAIHLFNIRFIESITKGNITLPFHVAKKSIPQYTPHGKKNITGYKFEKFVFDALPLTQHNFILETKREEEFAPVKNKTGVDSVETAQQLMINLYKTWLSEKNISIPKVVEKIEISPLFAVEPDDIPNSLTLPQQKEVYIA
ncbi:MAG: UDPGP type 1 family protein [Spirochaetes bacterium]|nr:UDPGP type 1 family protein [Spirochaetota bacterium]